MKIRMAILFALLGISLSASAGSVQIGDYTFYCQNTCIVSQTSSGIVVSDSMGGWVRIFSRYRPISVPNV